jgi:hypothetical protein
MCQSRYIEYNIVLVSTTFSCLSDDSGTQCTHLPKAGYCPLWSEVSKECMITKQNAVVTTDPTAKPTKHVIK